MKKHVLFKLLLTFMLALAFHIGWSQPSDLFISEYIEGSSNNKALEIYNGTGSSVTLVSGTTTNYFMLKVGNPTGTETWADGDVFTFTDGATIENEDVYVVYNSSADPSIIAEGDQSSTVTYFNGNDPVALVKDVNNNGTYEEGTDIILDVIGDMSGSSWGAELTWVRKLGFSGNSTFNLSEWDEYGQDTFDYIGFHIFADTEPPVPTFDPADGTTDVAIDVNPTITFDETIYTYAGDPVDNTNVEGLLTLTDGVDPVAFTASITGNVITVVPDANFDNEQDYTLTIVPVQDENGNIMAADASATFTTISASAPAIDLTSSHAGNTYYGGEDITVTWTSQNVTTLDLQVWLPVDAMWETIEPGLTAADGTVTTTPPVDIDYATTYKLRLKDAESETYSNESGEFTMIPVLPITEIQGNADVDGNSSYVNDFVKTGGRVSAVKSADNFFIQAGLGEFSGINVSETSHGLAVGDSIVIVAEVGEQYDMTQLSSVVTIANHGNFEPWTATTIATGDMGEAWECVLVRVENAEVIDNTLGYEEFSVSDGSGDVVVDDAIFSYDLPDNGRLFASITGPVEYSFGAFKILPRNVDDFVLLSNDATLSTFTLGGEDVTGLTDLEVADPVNDAGATLYVDDFTSFAGIVIEATDAAATVTVELNETVVDPGNYATQVLADDDVVVATVEAEDGTTAFYKVTLTGENRELEITGPTLPVTYETGDDVTFTWTSANIANVNIYVVDTEAHLINEEGSIDATSGTYTYTIANGDFGTFTIRIADASDETFFDETTEEATVNDIQHPEGIEFYPAMGAVDVPLGFTLSVLFDEDVVAGTGNFTIYDAFDDSEVLNFTEADFTINENELTLSVTGLDFETEYYILSDAGIIEDLSGNATPVLDDPTVWTFTTLDEPDYELFFSEYIEGSSNNKAIEIYNPGNTAVDLTPYVVKLGSNGDDWGNTLDLDGTLGAGEVYIIANSGAVQEILDLADVTSDVTYYNGNDALGLFKNDALIDAIGTQGEDPDNNEDGTFWDVAGIANATAEHTLVRKTGIYNGNTNWTESAGTNEEDSEWMVYDQDYFDNLGAHSTMPSSEAEILEFTFGTAIDYEDAVIDSELATVEISVIKGTDVTTLAPTITVSDGATIDPASGTVLDFTDPYMYTVTAQDETKKYWTVTVTELAELSDKANILEVQLAGVDSININETDTTATIYAPYGFDVTSVKPEFTVSAGASIADTAAARDFTDPQVYEVTAQDGSTIKNWEVAIITNEPMELTIYDIQYTEDASGASPYEGEIVKTSGIVTGVGGDGFFMQANDEEWNGIYVYAPDGNTATLGDSAWVVGTVDEYQNGTQISYVKDYIVIEQDVTLPDPIEITDLANTLTESHEGMLVKLINIECTDGPSSYEEWTFTDESGDEIMVDDILGYQHTFTIGTKYSITGLRQTYFGDKITPRNDDDIVDVSTGINNPDEIVSMNVYPNPNNGQFTFEMNASKAGTFKLEIINIQGQVVYQKQITQDGFYRESIDISDKARGMYYIRLNDGQSMKIAKIMIQ